MAPQHFGAQLLGAIKDVVLVVVVTHQNPYPRPAPTCCECARLGACWIGVWSVVANVGEPDVQVADGRWRTIFQRKETAGHATMENTSWPALHLPAKYIAVEAGTSLNVVGREIHKNQSVRFHGTQATKDGLMV